MQSLHPARFFMVIHEISRLESNLRSLFSTLLYTLPLFIFLLHVTKLKQSFFYPDCCPQIMGVVNVTPDSFSDGGSYYTTEQAVAYAKQLIDEGVDILDIGGESTRPGSQSVSVDEELNRVMPVIEQLLDQPVPISVDTSKPEVMRCAIESGVAMINDVQALQIPGALDAVQNSDTLICLMHMQGNPGNMQENPQYRYIVEEIIDFFHQRIAATEAAGISRERLIIDPGFGFGKTLQHNLQLLRDLAQFQCLSLPILAGLSRKSMLGKITDNPVEYRIHESVAAALLAVQNGARIVRVHDVKATKDALAIVAAVNEVDAS